MNNSIDRLLDGISATLRENVIPRIEDAYARGQAVGIIDVLSNLKPRIDWAHEPLKAEIEELHSALSKVETIFEGRPESPLAPVERLPERGADTKALLDLRSRLEDKCAETLQWLVTRLEKDEPAQAAMAALRDAMHRNLEREMKLISKPLFAEIAVGAKAQGDN